MKKRLYSKTLYLLFLIFGIVILYLILRIGELPYMDNTLSVGADLEKMMEAFVEKDYETYIDFTPAIIIQSIGGKQKYREFLDLYYDNLESSNLIIKGSRLDSIIQFQYSGLESQVLLIQKTDFEGVDTSFFQMNYLIGFKPLLGSWKFMNIKEFNLEEIRKVAPSVSIKFKKIFVELDKHPIF